MKKDKHEKNFTEKGFLTTLGNPHYNFAPQVDYLLVVKSMAINIQYERLPVPMTIANKFYSSRTTGEQIS